MAETKYDLKAFAQKFMETGSKADGARAAGYRPEEGADDNARQIGFRLFKDPQVQEEINALIEDAVQSSAFLVPMATKAIQDYLAEAGPDVKTRKHQAELGAKILQDFRASTAKPSSPLDLTDTQLIDELVAILGNDPQLIAELAKRSARSATASVAGADGAKAHQSGSLLGTLPEAAALLLPRKEVPAENVSGGEPDGEDHSR